MRRNEFLSSRFTLLCFFIFAFCLCSLNVAAEPQVTTVTPQPTVTPVAMGEIIPTIERETAQLQIDSDKRTELQRNFDRTADLPLIKATLKSINTSLSGLALNRMSLRELIEWQTRINSLRDDIDEHVSASGSWVEAIIREKVSLDERKKLWGITLTQTLKEVGSRSVSSRVKELLVELEEQVKLAQQDLDVASRVNVEFLSVKNQLGETIARIGKARDLVESDLFAHDAQLLFQGLDVASFPVWLLYVCTLILIVLFLLRFVGKIHRWIRLFLQGFGYAAVLLTIAAIFGYWRLTSFFAEGLLDSLLLGAFSFVCVRLIQSAAHKFLWTQWVESRDFLKRFRPILVQVLWKVLQFGAFFVWITGTLKSFGLWDRCFDCISRVVGINFHIGEIQLSLGGLIALAFLIWSGVFLSKFFRNSVMPGVYGRFGLDRGIQAAIDTGVHYLVVGACVLGGLSILGVSLQNLAILAGALSVGVGFGLQYIVNNTISGFIVLWERPIRPGDVISVNGVNGTVVRTNLRSTILQTGEEAEVIIPNTLIISNQVVNYTRNNARLRISLPITVEYGTDAEACLAILKKIVNESKRFYTEPKPDAFMKAVGPAGLDFVVAGTIPNISDRSRVESELLVEISKRFAEAGMSFASQRERQRGA